MKHFNFARIMGFICLIASSVIVLSDVYTGVYKAIMWATIFSVGCILMALADILEKISK